MRYYDLLFTRSIAKFRGANMSVLSILDFQAMLV
jgi:hypothetical protein